MAKQDAPNNKMGEMLGDLNVLSDECGSIPFGIERDECYQKYILPLLDELNRLGFSVEWDVDKHEYMLVELVKDERGWVHPTIRLRRLEP